MGGFRAESDGCGEGNSRGDAETVRKRRMGRRNGRRNGRRRRGGEEMVC
jgi:hypothetical protein